VTVKKKRDTNRGVEPPPALSFSRTKEITEEATITIGFTFFRTREPAEEASIIIGFSFSRITKPAEEVSTTIGLLSPKPVSRTKEITEEATITFGFTFPRTSHHRSCAAVSSPTSSSVSVTR
jgi:hypothetical protein